MWSKFYLSVTLNKLEKPVVHGILGQPSYTFAIFYFFYDIHPLVRITIDDLIIIILLFTALKYIGYVHVVEVTVYP